MKSIGLTDAVLDEDILTVSDDLILPKIAAQQEYEKQGITEVILEVQNKCQKFTLWDQLGQRGRDILMQAPMNK